MSVWPVTSGQALGTLVVDELIVPVTHIDLRDGKFLITASRPGPVPAVNRGSYTLHDRGGRVVARAGWHAEGMSWGRVSEDGTLTISLPMAIADRELRPAPHDEVTA